MIRWLAVLCLLASGGSASAGDLALLKIRIDKFERSYSSASNCEGEVAFCDFYVWNKYRATLLRSYAGSAPHRTFSMMGMGHSPYVDGLDLYVLVEHAKGEGRFQMDGEELFPGEDYVLVRATSIARHGFCLSLDKEDLKNGTLANAADTLRRDHPCKDN